MKHSFKSWEFLIDFLLVNFYGVKSTKLFKTCKKLLINANFRKIMLFFHIWPDFSTRSTIIFTYLHNANAYLVNKFRVIQNKLMCIHVCIYSRKYWIMLPFKKQGPCVKNSHFCSFFSVNYSCRYSYFAKVDVLNISQLFIQR